MKASNKQKSLKLPFKNYGGLLLLFLFTRMKELEWARINWKWLSVQKFTNKYVPNKHTEKSVISP